MRKTEAGAIPEWTVDNIDPIHARRVIERKRELEAGYRKEKQPPSKLKKRKNEKRVKIKFQFPIIIKFRKLFYFIEAWIY